MAQNTNISWTNTTWNPIRGCRRVSAGCQNCYAEKTAHRFCGEGLPYEGLVDSKGRWNGEVRFVPEKLDEPLRWRKPQMVFVNSMSDLFYEKLTNEEIAAIFAVMAAAGRHVFQVLTKRPERALEWFRWLDAGGPFEPGSEDAASSPLTKCITCFERLIHGKDCARTLKHPGPVVLEMVENGYAWPLPNVWLGVSVEDQAAADVRIPILLRCPATVRWISAEPLLGPVDLSRWLMMSFDHCPWENNDPNVNNGFDDCAGCPATLEAVQHGSCGAVFNHRLDWVVVGGESGPGARPMHPKWARDLRDQCQAAGVAFHFKQWGAWAQVDNIYPRGADLLDDLNVGRADNPHEPGSLLSMIGSDNQRSYIAVGADGAEWLNRVGKKAAGRELDGRTWDDFPGGAC